MELVRIKDWQNTASRAFLTGRSGHGLGSHGLSSDIVAYIVLAFLVFIAVAGVASIFSTRWRHLALRAIIWLAAGLVWIYAIGRGIAEFWTVDYSDPVSYARSWGGPSLAGVFLVHSGPGFVALVTGTVWLYRRRSHKRVARAAAAGPPDPA
jgi:hypothetical protein